MKLLTALISGIFCFALPSILLSQDFSNKGKDFWVAYGYHQVMTSSNAQDMVLYFATDQVTNIQITIPGIAYSQTLITPPGNNIITSATIPKFGVQDARLLTEGKQNKGIHITSDKPMVAYAHIYNTSVSGSCLLFPTNTLGNEYYSINYKNISNTNNANSWFYVVAVEPGTTTVDITPSANTIGWLAGNTYTINLTQGEVYNVMGQLLGTSPVCPPASFNTPATYLGVDLTGSKIQSRSAAGTCKKIAVYSGSGRISITANDCQSSSDNYMVQSFPRSAWGKKYLTAPTEGLTGNMANNFFRICVTDPTTVVRVNRIVLTGLINNFYYEIGPTSTPNLIEANNPITVAQYTTSQNQFGNGAPGDPEVIYLSPVEQNINDITFNSNILLASTTPPNQPLTPHQHLVSVIIPNRGTAISSFRIDGVIPSIPFTVHPQDPNYSYIIISGLTLGQHRMTSDSGFNALAYGYAWAESYGYNAGANVKDLYQFVSIQNQYATVNFPATCRGTPFSASIVFPYQPIEIKWVFGTALNALGLADTTISTPATLLDSTWVLNGRQLYRYNLPRTYSIPTSGTYAIKIIANNPTPDGCSGVQEIDYDLQVFNPPVADFNFTTNGCVTTPVNFTDTTNSGGRPIIKWSWDFGDDSTAIIPKPVHTYSAPGTYNASFSVITDVGCISDTAKKVITLTDLPIAKFGAGTPYCSGKSITFTDTSSALGGATLTKWYWDFGDGSPVITATNNTTQVHTYANAGTYNATLKVETSTGCQSLIVPKQIIVRENPLSSFALTGNICMPSGTANFTNNSTIGDGTQNQLSYLWDFGDGKTSTDTNPVHNYTTTGPFTVTLTTTSNNGCVDDTIRAITNIFIQPKAKFIVDSVEACFGGTFNFTDQSTATNSTVNQWFWDFGDGTTSDQPNPNKQYAASGNYTVSLYTNSAAGCRSDTTTLEMAVLQQPTANFNTSSPACENRDLTFTDISVANAGNLVKWTWDYGDGSNAVLSNQLPFIHRYATAGTYDVKLQLETDKGCTSTVLTKPVIIYDLPKAGFISPAVCLVDPFAPFMDTSSIAVGTINSWQWNFGDPNANASNPNTSTLQNPSHRYSLTGTYTGTLIVTSNQGCTDTVSQAFTVNGSIPLANFAVQNFNTLCSNNDVVITNTSTVDFGSIVRVVIYWDFANDPTNQTVDAAPVPGRSYTNRYPEFGSPASITYSVRMVSYSGVNCLNEITKTITVLATPQVKFDPLSEVCSNTNSFQITQAGITNALPGTGIFTGTGVSPTGLFNPTAAGAGTHSIRFTYTGTNSCVNLSDQTILVNPTPIAFAGPDKTVLQGGQVGLTPAQNANFPVTYTWSPPDGLSSTTIPDPLASPQDDITYTLTVTSEKGCSTSDDVFVNVLKEPQVPNIFSPNGDGVHDTWQIPFLETYPYATVEVFNRYGQTVFYSVGYKIPWDGTIKGKPVPQGTYYYIVDPKFGRKKQAGYVDVIR